MPPEPNANVEGNKEEEEDARDNLLSGKEEGGGYNEGIRRRVLLLDRGGEGARAGI